MLLNPNFVLNSLLIVGPKVFLMYIIILMCIYIRSSHLKLSAPIRKVKWKKCASNLMRSWEESKGRKPYSDGWLERCGWRGWVWDYSMTVWCRESELERIETSGILQWEEYDGGKYPLHATPTEKTYDEDAWRPSLKRDWAHTGHVKV
jgi:hypothetical protein